MGSCLNKDLKEAQITRKKEIKRTLKTSPYDDPHSKIPTSEDTIVVTDVKIKSPALIDERAYEDMPEWSGDLYTGVGIKRIKSYKCDLSLEELNRRREDFWSYKIRSAPIWNQIRQACMMDDIRASTLINFIGLKPVNGSINLLKDSVGKEYRIPNYCICDPHFESLQPELTSISPSVTVEINNIPVTDQEAAAASLPEGAKILSVVPVSSSSQSVAGKPLRIDLFNIAANDKMTIEIEDNINGNELKQIYIGLAEGKPEDCKNMRLFYGGVEITDSTRIDTLNIKNNDTIQVLRSN